MKCKRLLFFLVLAAFPTFAYQQQWFSTYQEYGDTVDFSCTNQCVMLVGPIDWSDTVQIKGAFQWNGMVGYGFLLGQQVMPGQTLPVNGSNSLDQQFPFAQLPFYSQIPDGAQLVLIVQGNVQWHSVGVHLSSLGLFTKWYQWFTQALEYKEYNPRTINFLEWPLRNGMYINQAFFWLIIILLVACAFIYAVTPKKKNKQTSLWFGIGVLVFFWVFFDFFSTVNQVKIYNQTMSASDIMENGRVGRTSDLYQFLDFIKTKVPYGEKGAFIAPYPFDFEGKYHIYPDVKFGPVTGVNYIFWYNSYGGNNPFNFVDPVYTGGILTWNGLKLPVQEEIVRRPYAKIYLLKK